ncbi:MAG: response regulator [Synergistaceae bacterium]|jgi:PAS domain S-box-containing protein|nr:response regulator [Synergistaceae bacterium]
MDNTDASREIARLRAENETLIAEKTSLDNQTKKLNRQISSLQKMLGRTDAVARTRDRLAYALKQEQSRQERYMNMMLENSSNIILLLDKNGRFAYCTNTFLRIAGISNFGLIDGRHYSEVFERFNNPSFLQHVERSITKAVEERDTIQTQEALDMGGGESRVYFTNTTAMLNEACEVEGIMLLYHDVTETLRAKDAAETANRAKSNFLASMSHEIRTPLNAVNGLAELELRKNHPADTLSNLEKIYGSGVTLLNIINDILDISKIESGRFDLLPMDYEVASIISDTVSMNIVRIGSKPITFKLDADENLPSKLFGDELRIKQILNNLLSNAIKYTPEGAVEFKISSEADGDEIWLDCSVSDSGIGIAEENIAKLFGEYQQVDMLSHRTIEGTGLGLSICKRLVEIMGGEITVKSEYGHGSTFSVRIRQKITDARPIGKENAANLKAFRFLEGQGRRVKNINYVRMPYGRVLVVDDVQTNLDVAKGMMAAYGGLTIHCVLSGRQAVELVRDAEVIYDAIFMDQMMPEMDGIETVRIIRSNIDSDYARTVPIIALTANAIVGNDKIFLENGFQAFLTKPIDVVKLDAAMRRFVRDKQSEETLRDAEDAASAEGQKQDRGTIMAGILEKTRINGVDLSAGMRRFNNSSAVYLRVIKSFLQNIPKHLEELRNVTEATLPEYAILAHGVKGSCYGISADEAGRMAESLEIAAKSGDFAHVMAGNETFIRRVEELMPQFQALLESEEGTQESDARNKQPAPDRKLLEKLRDASADYDIDTMQSIMDELDGCEYEAGGDLVACLKDQILNFRYDEIGERLSEILGP